MKSYYWQIVDNPIFDKHDLFCTYQIFLLRIFNKKIFIIFIADDFFIAAAGLFFIVDDHFLFLLKCS